MTLSEDIAKILELEGLDAWGEHTSLHERLIIYCKERGLS